MSAPPGRERHYGALLDGAQAGIAGRLSGFEAALEEEAKAEAGEQSAARK